MGRILDEEELGPEAGEYHAEVRSESFYLGGEYNGTQIVDVGTDGRFVSAAGIRRHGIFLYPFTEVPRQGTVEILIEDIPKIRAVLDAVEAYVERRGY